MSAAGLEFVLPGSQGMLSIFSPWLNDKEISEIMINRPGELFIEKQGQMLREEVPRLTRTYLRRLFTFIANESDQILDEAHPLLSASLYDGSRVQLVIPPVAEHYCLSIRRQSIQALSIEDYQSQGFFDEGQSFYFGKALVQEKEETSLKTLYQNKQWAAFLCQAVKARKNIVISGGTSSGKTTFLNALLKLIPLDERLIILEDTKEVDCPHPNQLSLIASKGEQGKSNIIMQDLVQASLRLRPDRIIMGEIRGKEILDFIGSCSTGHSGAMTSIHANNPKIALMRMAQLYKLNQVPSMTEQDILSELQSVIDIIVQIGKTKQGRKLLYCYYKEAVA